MAVDPQEISQEEYNKRVTEWGSKLAVKLRASIQMLTNEGKADLVKSLRLKTGKWFGVVDKLAFHFKRHGVFVHKGVGRGYHIEAGKVVRGSSKAFDKTTDVNARLKQFALRSAAIQRVPKEWLNPVVEKNISTLANLVAELQADKVVNATKILIK